MVCLCIGIYRSRLQQHRDYFWDKTLVNTSIRYRIQYHALLNMYRVRNESSGEVYNFSTLSAALDLMSTIRDFRVMDKADYVSGKTICCRHKSQRLIGMPCLCRYARLLILILNGIYPATGHYGL